MGRGYDKNVDYIQALSRHFDAEQAEKKMAECHKWLSKENKDGIDRVAMECEQAYDLRCWNSYPGDAPTLTGVMLQNVSFGYAGCHGGPTKSSDNYGKELKAEVQV